jgi:outer membrane protein assembly factor BamB
MTTSRFLSFAALVLGPISVHAADADSVLKSLDSPRGLVVVLGDSDGKLAFELIRKSELTVFVQSADAKEVDAIRREADKTGLLGTRIWVQLGKAGKLNLGDDLADAIVVQKPGLVANKELQRVLRPGGKFFDNGIVVTKEFDGKTDEWTHPYHGPDNNPLSLDKVAKRPYLTHFMAEPWYCPLPQMSVISGGRIFKVFGDRSSALPQEDMLNKLIAMNAFNGTILWKRDLPPNFMIHRNTFIATPKTLYLADDKSCKLIDTATGKVREEITVPDKLSDGPVWKWMALEGNVLYALVGDKEGSDETLRGPRIRGAGWPWWGIKNYNFGFGRTLLAIDAESKKIIWSHKENDPIDSRGVCMKNGRIYYYSDGKFLAALDTKNGKVAWKNEETELLEAIGPHGKAQHWMLGFASTAYMKASDDALYFAGPQRPRLVAASTKDGKLLWQHKEGNVQLVLRPEGVYALGEGRINSVESSHKFEPLTGKILSSFPSRDRCTRATGCLDSIFTRGGAGGSTAVFDITQKDPKMGVVSPMRPACQDGVVAAHGYLYWGPWMCRCDMTQLGVISLGSGGSFDYTQKATDADRLVSGSATGARVPIVVTPDDWPAYRKNNARTAVTNHTIPAKVRQIWEFKDRASTISTAPVAVGGITIVGGMDGVVRALNAKGMPLWTAYTGGPIRYPPAVANNRVFVGSSDGCVYCFETGNGELHWRFRAAPIERTIPIYGSLSSTWPVCGVLVEKDTVYAAAGMSTFDGTHVYALDAKTGAIRWQNNTSGNTGNELPDGGVSVQGPLLLHKEAIYMAAGNKPTIASYAVSDGKFSAAGGGRGKDLFIRKGTVQGSGFPMYWRPEDDHFLSPMELEFPGGVLAVNTDSIGLVSPKQPEGAKKIATDWSAKPYQEISAVVIAKNAILVTGLDRDAKKPTKTSPGLCAVSLKDGSIMWKQPLPGNPVAWGLAQDRTGRIIVTMIDGRVVAFTGE